MSLLSSPALASDPPPSAHTRLHIVNKSWTKLIVEHERTGRLVPRDCQTRLDTLERGYNPGEKGYGCKSARELAVLYAQLTSRTKIVHSELDSLSPGSSPMPDSQSLSPRSMVSIRPNSSSKLVFLVETVNWQR